jgi:hypothetical protein
VLTNHARQVLGIEAVRGHARLKLERIASVTGDADAGAKRRTNSRFQARDKRETYANRRGPNVFGGRPHPRH